MDNARSHWTIIDRLHEQTFLTVSDSQFNSNIRLYLLYGSLSSLLYAKQKHLGCKKVRGQSEATLQTGRRDQKV